MGFYKLGCVHTKLACGVNAFAHTDMIILAVQLLHCRAHCLGLLVTFAFCCFIYVNEKVHLLLWQILKHTLATGWWFIWLNNTDIRMFRLDRLFFFQGLRVYSGFVPAGHLLVARSRKQCRRRMMTGCHLWTQKYGAGAVGLRGNWAMEINSPGLSTQIHTFIMNHLFTSVNA